MRILIPILSFGNSGGYRVLSKLADEMISLGHHVEFLSPEGSDLPYFPTSAKIKWINEKGELYEDYAHKSFQKDHFFAMQQKLAKALKKLPFDSFDVLFANHSLTILPILRAGLEHKTVYYVQSYEPDMYAVMGGVKNSIIRVLSSLSYRKKIFTIVNAEVFMRFKRLHTDRVLHPGIDFSFFYPKNIDKDFESKDAEIIIGTVGRLERFKGTQYILDAFKKIKIEFPNAKLHVAFGNPKDFDGDDNIKCFQLKGDKALGDFYRSLDFYICGGFIHLGAFHYPVVEAMACGVSLITTAYYGASKENSWLTAACDATDIVKQFQSAIAQPDLRKKKIAQALKDIKHLSWNETGQRLESFLNEFASTKKARLIKN